jgi:SNF2 family DNA or RNA helicase
VFLLSVRSGAVGINLTAANHVFLLEPCLNPALEEQAIGELIPQVFQKFALLLHDI